MYRGNILAVWQVVHDWDQKLFHDGAQATRTRLAFQGELRDGIQCRWLDVQFAVIHLKEAAVLLNQGVLGLGEHLDQRFTVQVIHRGHDRQASDELWNKTELH